MAYRLLVFIICLSLAIKIWSNNISNYYQNNLFNIDTLEVIDTTVIIDTLIIKNKVNKKSNFRLYASVGTFTPTYNYNSSKSTYIANLLNEYSVPQTSYKFTLGVGYFKQNYSLFTGVALALFKQQFNFTGFTYSNKKDSYKIDTVDIYYVKYNNQQIKHVVTDTVWKMRTDSALFKSKVANYYLLLEFPILFGYCFKNKSSSITLQTGPTPYFILNTNGKSINNKNSNLLESLTSYSSFIGLSWQFNVSVDIRLNKYFSIDFTPFYTNYLTSFYNIKTGIILNTTVSGFMVGLRYRGF